MEVWGQSPQRDLGAEPLVRGLGGDDPLKLKVESVLTIMCIISA